MRTFRPTGLIAAAALVTSLAALSAVCLSAPACAEQSELRIAKQYGLGYLQMMVMEDRGIVEKNAKAAGLGEQRAGRVLLERELGRGEEQAGENEGLEQSALARRAQGRVCVAELV